jgi:Cu+-exporting ATPase
MTAEKTLEVPIKGMDCAECSLHVQHAIAELPGVESVDVFLASEKAIVHLDPALVDVPAIRKAVEEAGYSVPEFQDQAAPVSGYENFTRSVLTLLGVVCCRGGGMAGSF